MNTSFQFPVTVSVEFCVMSDERLSTSAILSGVDQRIREGLKAPPPWAKYREQSTLVPEVAASVPERAPDIELPDGVQLALLNLNMRRSQVCTDVYTHVRSMGAGVPSGEDYTALVRLGYALPVRNGFHMTSPRGAHAADALAKQIALNRGFHYERFDHGSRYDKTVICTCGWRAVRRRSPRVDRELINAFLKHCAQVESVRKVVVPALQPMVMDEVPLTRKEVGT